MHLFRTSWLYFVFIAVPFVFIWLHGTRSEGSSLAMEAGEVGSSDLNFNCHPTKLDHGGRSQFGLGRVFGSNTTTQSIKKRSLKRAHRRLQLNGYTWYRGQYWQQVTFPKPPDFIADLTPESTTNHRCQPSEHLPSNRLVFWHWNSGTLSSTRYQELLRYLHLQKVDVALISETHWRYNSEWSTQYWHAIHTCSELSCSSEKASGLAKRCCQAHQLSWRVVAPGRLLHCRLHIASKPIDILGIYQYPWNTSVAQRNRRQSIWVHLRDTLQALPQRNILCVLGDFNCSLPSIDRLVGTPNFRTSSGRQYGPQHGDMATFACLLQDFQLTALNSWLASHGATYRSRSGDSRIDFILTKHRDADNMAKQVGLIDASPFLPAGAHHIPMMTSLNYKYYRPPRHHRQCFSRQVKQQCLDAFRQDTLHWQKCESGINFALRTSTQLASLDDIYKIREQGAHHYFQPSMQSRSDAFDSYVVTKWKHDHALKLPGTPVLPQLFHKWRHCILFRKMEREQTRHTLCLKLQKLQSLVEEAQIAHERHDSFKLYQVITKHVFVPNVYT